jgi:hypothetical protein
VEVADGKDSGRIVLVPGLTDGGRRRGGLREDCSCFRLERWRPYR